MAKANRNQVSEYSETISKICKSMELQVSIRHTRKRTKLTEQGYSNAPQKVIKLIVQPLHSLKIFFSVTYSPSSRY